MLYISGRSEQVNRPVPAFYLRIRESLWFWSSLWW